MLSRWPKDLISTVNTMMSSKSNGLVIRLSDPYIFNNGKYPRYTFIPLGQTPVATIRTEAACLRL